MKKNTLYIVLSFTLMSCCKIDSPNGLMIDSVIISENNTLQKDNFTVYNIEISLKNNSNDTIRFWSYTHGWYLNFFFNTQIMFYKNFKSDAYHIITLKPRQKYNFKGIILYNNELSKIEEKKLLIGFKVYNAKKITEFDYVNSVFSELSDTLITHEHAVKNYPDTIWYKRIKINKNSQLKPTEW